MILRGICAKSPQNLARVENGASLRIKRTWRASGVHQETAPGDGGGARRRWSRIISLRTDQFNQRHNLDFPSFPAVVLQFLTVSLAENSFLVQGIQALRYGVGEGDGEGETEGAGADGLCVRRDTSMSGVPTPPVKSGRRPSHFTSPSY